MGTDTTSAGCYSNEQKPMWAAWSSGLLLPLHLNKSGRWHSGHINGMMWAPVTVSQPPPGKDGTQHTSSIEVVQLVDYLDGQLECLVVLGRTWIEDCQYAPETIEGTCCLVPVDAGSSATLVRPVVGKNGTTVFPTMVRLSQEHLWWGGH